MTRAAISRASGIASRGLRSMRLAPRRVSLVRTTAAPSSSIVAVRARFLSTTPAQFKGILPDSDDPAPPEVQDTEVKAVPHQLTDGEYHEVADEYLEIVSNKLEEIAESRDDVEVEFSAGVLTFTFPNAGTYVVNKQPPNKQIWLSSPISGPKRFDYVLWGEGQDQKEDTATGDWVYLRDGSTMTGLFGKELGIDLTIPIPH